MAKTIKQQAETLLTKYGWTYDASRRSPGWTHPRTTHAVYLGTHGAVRYGKSQTDSKPLTYISGEALTSLEMLLLRVAKIPLPAPTTPIINPITELRRKAHAIIQTMTEKELEVMVANSPENRERRRQQLRNKPFTPTDAQVRQAYWANEQLHYGLDGSNQLEGNTNA